MNKIMEGVYFIPGQDEMIPDANAYVLGNPSSKDLSLIDVGLIGKGRYKVQSILKMGIELNDIKRIIMTHTHFDHIGCLPEIKKQMPGSELWVHEKEAKLLEEGDERAIYGMDMFQKMAHIQYGIKPGTFTFGVNRKLAGGERLTIGGMSWEVIHIPGHSLGSIGLYHPAEKILISGDVVYAGHAIGRFDFYGANASDLKKSLLQLADLKVNILLPGHNEIVKKLPDGYILKTLKQWEPYLL